MSGPLDPTQITTFELSKPDVVVKLKAIATTKMPDDWEWDLEPFSRANPPPDNFTRQVHEVPAAFTANRTEWDKEDPDSVQNTPLHEMDANHSTLEVNRSAPGRTPSAPKTTAAPTPPEPPLKIPSPAKGKGPADQAPSPGLGAGGIRFGPAGPETSEGNTTPDTDDHRGGADFTSPPERTEDSGARYMGPDNVQAGPLEPIAVPSAPESSSPTAPPASSTPASASPPPASPWPASSSVIPLSKPTPSHSKITSPPPAKAIPASGKPPVPASASKKKKLSSRKPPAVSSEDLSSALQATKEAPTCSKAITLHTSRAAASIGDTLALHAGQIMERS
nr:vegetative cell wall protein gp1-like [Lolium perenne]